MTEKPEDPPYYTGINYSIGDPDEQTIEVRCSIEESIQKSRGKQRLERIKDSLNPGTNIGRRTYGEIGLAYIGSKSFEAVAEATIEASGSLGNVAEILIGSSSAAAEPYSWVGIIGGFEAGRHLADFPDHFSHGYEKALNREPESGNEGGRENTVTSRFHKLGRQEKKLEERIERYLEI